MSKRSEAGHGVRLEKAARLAEEGVTRAILRWKYKRDGKQLPQEERLKEESRVVVGRARGIAQKRGKNVWNALKGVLSEERENREASGE